MEWGNARRTVLESLLECATLQSQRNTGRSAKKHAGTAQDILKRELAALAALASSGSAVGDINASSSSSSVHQPRDFFVEPPLQTVTVFLQNHDADEPWPDVALWLVQGYFEPKLLLKLNPTWSEESHLLLPVLRCDLKAYALKRMINSHVQFVRSGIVIKTSDDGKTSTCLLYTSPSPRD